MANFIRFQDTVQFKATSVETTKKDNLSMQVQGSNRPLIVKIAATHAGIITRNNGFYLPDRMRKGAASFTANYGKPVQVHHNQDADPVGRVLKAEYIDISSQVRDKYQDSLAPESILMNKFLDGRMSYIDSVNYICDELNSSSSILEDPNYAGLGYIQLTAAISDPEAAQKILDGRYLTGSVGVSTNKAVCSVCKQDWTDSSMGKCEHRPGKHYDGVKAFLITGDLTYDEYSFVNVPADRHSRVLEMNTNGITDSFEMEESLGKDFSVSLDSHRLPEGIEIKDYLSTIDGTVKEETQVMTETQVTKLVAPFKEKYSKYIDEAELATIVAALDALTDLAEGELEVRVEEALDKAAITKIFTLETKLDALKEVRSFMDPAAIEVVLKDKIETVEDFYKALNHAEWLDYSEEEDEELARYKLEHPEDAKLHAAARKRLPGSSFCGPNRSFPVPDCAHVTAARRLIGRAKASGATKSGILSCVSRKAKALSCGDSKKDNVMETTPIIDTATETVVAPDPLKELQDKHTTLATAHTELETKYKELTDLFDKLKLEHEKMIADHKVMLETYTNKDATELSAVREELKLALTDLTQMSDQLVTSQEKILLLQATRVCDYKKLSGETIEDEVKLLDELQAKSSEDLDKLLAETSVKVDMKKIADSINTGLTRTPTGSVSDPTGGLENVTKIHDRKTVEQIANEYMRIKLGGKSNYGTGREGAERFKADMQQKGLIPTG